MMNCMETVSDLVCYELFKIGKHVVDLHLVEIMGIDEVANCSTIDLNQYRSHHSYKTTTVLAAYTSYKHAIYWC